MFHLSHSFGILLSGECVSLHNLNHWTAQTETKPFQGTAGSKKCLRLSVSLKQDNGWTLHCRPASDSPFVGQDDRISGCRIPLDRLIKSLSHCSGQPATKRA